MLGYSDTFCFRLPYTSNSYSSIEVHEIPLSPVQFSTDVNTLMNNLSSQASYNGTSIRKVAAGSRVTADNQTIYAMVQCLPDLTAEL